MSDEWRSYCLGEVLRIALDKIELRALRMGNLLIVDEMNRSEIDQALDDEISFPVERDVSNAI